MRKRSKYTIIGAVILSLAVVTGIGATMAYGPQGPWGRGIHPGFHGMGFHGQSHSDDIADFIIWKMDRHVKELNLNEKQVQELSKIKEGIKTAIANVMQERKEFHEIVHGEMTKEKPDMNALASLVNERVKQIPEMVSENINLFLTFYNMLDQNQKGQVIEMFRWRMDSAQKGT